MAWSSRREFACLALAFVVAGCSSDGGGPGASDTSTATQTQAEATSNMQTATPAPPSSHSWTAWEVAPEFIDCRTTAIALVADREKTEARLGPGFSAAGLVPGTSDVNLEVFACDAVVIDNQTVVKPVAFATVLAFCQVPDEVDDELLDVCTIEFFTDSPTLLDLMVAHGVPTQLATINLADTVTGDEALVEVPGQLKYSATGIGDEGSHGGDVAPLKRRHHHQFEDKPAWLYLNSTHRYTAEYPRAVNLEVQGGFLGSATPAEANPTLSSITDVSCIIEFGRTQVKT